MEGLGKDPEACPMFAAILLEWQIQCRGGSCQGEGREEVVEGSIVGFVDAAWVAAEGDASDVFGLTAEEVDRVYIAAVDCP